MEERRADRRSSRAFRLMLGLVYWLAVVAVALGLVVAMLLYLESRDPADLGARAPAAGAVA